MEDEKRNVNTEGGTKPKKLLDQVRDVLRLKHGSIRTKEAHTGWIVRYILFHNKRHLKDMGTVEIETFLTHLRCRGKRSSAHDLDFELNLSFSSLVFSPERLYESCILRLHAREKRAVVEPGKIRRL